MNLNIPPHLEEILQDAAVIFEDFQQKTADVLLQEDNGQIDDATSDEIIAEAIEGMASSLYEILEIDVEESRMEEDGEYMEASRYMGQMASFSQGFGQVLAGIVENGFNDVNDGVALISEITGLGGNEISGLFDGSVVIDPDTASELANAFNLDDSDYNQFVNLAVNAYSETLKEDGDDDYSLDIAEGIYAEPVATMSADVQLRAEFEALKEREAVGETLRSIERQCDQLVANGNLTTHERRLLIGEFDSNQDRVAQFSSVCSQLNVPVGQQLDRIQYYLYIAQSRPPLAMFGQVVEEPLVDVYASAEDVDAVKGFRDRYGFR